MRILVAGRVGLVGVALAERWLERSEEPRAGVHGNARGLHVRGPLQSGIESPDWSSENSAMAGGLHG
jgi:hypothetical protein